LLESWSPFICNSFLAL